MLRNIKIAGISIDIITKVENKFSKNLKRFQSYSEVQEDALRVYIKKSHMIEIPDSMISMNENLKWFQDPSGKKGIHIYIFDSISDRVMSELQTDRDWKEFNIISLDQKSDLLSAFTGPLGEILFRNRIIYHQGIVIHAAAIEWKGKGILFSAPSGTGKSTQAKLWKKYMGADIINEDRPAVRIRGKQAYVYGTPWNGSSQICKNKEVPLAAVVFLEKAAENKIQVLNEREGIARLLPRSFLPYHDTEHMKLAIKNIELLSDIVPFFLLECRPDKEAVEMLYECMK